MGVTQKHMALCHDVLRPAQQGNVAVSFAQRACLWLGTWGMLSAADDHAA